MSLAVTPCSTTTPTMSSREIADLLESRHDSVKRSIERLSSQGIIRFTPTVETSHDGAGARPVEVYLLEKRDTYIVVAQISPQFTARLVDRWQELEAQVAAPSLPNFSDPVAAARAWADAKEAEQKALIQLEAAKPAVEFVDRYVDASGSKGIREVAKLLRANEREFIAFLIDRQIMYRLGGRLTPYAQHLDADRFEVKAGVAQNEHAYTTARFTTKGIQWIAGLWIANQAGDAK